MKLRSYSFYVIFLSSILLIWFRFNNRFEKEIAWDIFGYYLPLPACFIYDDPLLNEVDWVKKINDERNLAGTLYMISSNDKGEPMYLFLFGMSLFFLPFFLLAHGYSALMGLPMDGFSETYQVFLVIGAIIYTMIGLYYLRKILLHFFTDRLTALILLLIIFGTNLANHLSIKNLEPVNVLFLLMTLVIWNTIQWHQSFKLKNLIGIASAVGLMGLIKPTESLSILIPLLWNVTTKKSLMMKFKLIYLYRNQFIISIIIVLFLASPQITYWLIKTGRPIFDSYKNAGIGLDLWSPHILNVLFSFRKGWLVYTPLMVFSLMGLYVFYKRNKTIAFGLILHFILAFYIVSSWTEWWYGAGFSNRPLITYYPTLAIGLGYFFLFLKKQTWLFKIGVGILLAFFVFLNQFQWWQYRNYILDPYRTTAGYYFATFLKTTVTDQDKEKLLVQRDFDKVRDFDDQHKYQAKLIQSIDFEKPYSVELPKGLFKPESDYQAQIQSDSLNKYFHVTAEDVYSFSNLIKYNALTSDDHIWVEFNFNIRSTTNQSLNDVYFVTTMSCRNGDYGYLAPELKTDSANQWQHYKLYYLTPEIRNHHDRLKYYFWNPNGRAFDIDQMRVRVFEKRK